MRGDTVVLNGSGSSDADGDSLTYSWTLVSVPPGSSAALQFTDGPDPALVADKIGSYVVSLVVNDGKLPSTPAKSTVTVVVPAPSVTITAPQDLSIVNTTPVAVSGTVTDGAATVSVNGVSAVVDANSGNFTVSVPLQSGSNTITATAVNATGTGAAAIDVTLNTANAPVATISAPAKNFLLGKVYLVGAAVTPNTVTVTGTVRVYTTQVSNTPTVTADGVVATVQNASFSGCPAGPPQQCFSYTATIPVDRGRHTIQVLATDVLGGTGTSAVSGTSDVAYHETGPEYTAAEATVNPQPWSGPTPRLTAVVQTDTLHPRQNNRAHEMDGCSLPSWVNNRNDPMGPFATQTSVSTAFGAGNIPPTEFFVHGQSPAQALPCSHHDVCYQTAGSVKATCDQAFYVEMQKVCNKAYPVKTGVHLVYDAERTHCLKLAEDYYSGVQTLGQARFDARQKAYAYP
ncbi:MAG: PKD domain-containing protein [Gemmatimonadaceae bacterium]